MDALEKFSVRYLRAETEIAVLNCVVEPTQGNKNRANDYCERLAGYILSQFGAKFAGPQTGPRRDNNG